MASDNQDENIAAASDRGGWRSRVAELRAEPVVRPLARTATGWERGAGREWIEEWGGALEAGLRQPQPGARRALMATFGRAVK